MIYIYIEIFIFKDIIYQIGISKYLCVYLCVNIPSRFEASCKLCVFIYLIYLPLAGDFRGDPAGFVLAGVDQMLGSLSVVSNITALSAWSAFCFQEFLL